MESFFAQMYLDIQERIKTEVPEIRWIEQDFGQEVYDQWRPNVDFPAALIDFPDATYEAQSGTGQFATTQIGIRLFFAPFCQSYEAAPVEVKQEALQYFEVEQKVVNALHGWEPAGGYCQKLIRERAASNNRNDITILACSIKIMLHRI